MADYSIEVDLRDATGKGAARKLRQSGRIPGVCYGGRLGSVPVSLEAHTLERLLATSDAGMNTLIDLRAPAGSPLEGHVVLVRELQRDPVRGSPLHADLVAVDLTQKIEVSVPIHVTGKAKGVELSGGILDQALRELEVECLPRAIPREIVLDVTHLEVGDSLHVRDIALPEGVTLVSEADLSVLSVVAPTVEEAAAPEEAAEAEEAAAPAEGAEPAPESEEKSGD